MFMLHDPEEVARETAETNRIEGVIAGMRYLEAPEDLIRDYLVSRFNIPSYYARAWLDYEEETPAFELY